jgi:transposase-like protein
MYKRQVVEALRTGLWVSEIAQQIQVGTKTIREWRQRDPVFDEQYREAETAFIDSLEREAVRRALHGTAEVIVNGGQIVMDPRSSKDDPQPLMRRNYSDGLMMFVLKGRRREVYGDKVETDNRHSVNFEDASVRLQQKLRALAGRGSAPAAIEGATSEGAAQGDGNSAETESGAAADPESDPGAAVEPQP